MGTLKLPATKVAPLTSYYELRFLVIIEDQPEGIPMKNICQAEDRSVGMRILDFLLRSKMLSVSNGLSIPGQDLHSGIWET